MAAAAAVIAAGGLTAVFWPSHSAPDPAACKQAMAAAYAKALTAGQSAAPAAEPAACRGVPTSTVSGFAAQIMAGH